MPRYFRPAARAASAISSSVCPPSLQSVWQWNVPVRSLELDQVGQAPVLGGLDLADVLAQLGRDVGQPEGREQVGLGRGRRRRRSWPARAYSLSVQPPRQRPLAHRDVVRLRAR